MDAGRRRIAGAVEAGRGAAVGAGVQVLFLCLAQPSQCRGFTPACTNDVEAERIEDCLSDALHLVVSCMSSVGWSGYGALLRKETCFVENPTLTHAAHPLPAVKMFTVLWMWRQEYQHHEQLPLAFNGTWPSWNSDLDNRPW